MVSIRSISLAAGSAATVALILSPAHAEEMPAQVPTMAEATGNLSAPAEANSPEATDLDVPTAASHYSISSAAEAVVVAEQAEQKAVNVEAIETSGLIYGEDQPSTTAATFFEAPEAEGISDTAPQAEQVAQVTRPLYRGVAPFYVGVGGNIGIVDSDETAVGDFGFNLISKISLGPRFSVRPTATFSEEDVSVAVPLTYNFNPLDLGEFSVYPAAGVGIDIGDDIGLLLNGGIDVPISRQFTLNGQLNLRATNEVGLGISLGVGYNFPFFFE